MPYVIASKRLVMKHLNGEDLIDMPTTNATSPMAKHKIYWLGYNVHFNYYIYFQALP